jgi:hypothetical protein
MTSNYEAENVDSKSVRSGGSVFDNITKSLLPYETRLVHPSDKAKQGM